MAKISETASNANQVDTEFDEHLAEELPAPRYRLLPVMAYQK